MRFSDSRDSLRGTAADYGVIAAESVKFVFFFSVLFSRFVLYTQRYKNARISRVASEKYVFGGIFTFTVRR